MRHTDGLEYAIKQVDLKEDDPMDYMKEIEHLGSFRHPSIITFKDAFITPSNSKNTAMHVVMEIMNKGTLAGLIASNSVGQQTSEDSVWKMAIQLLSGLDYLHELDVVHLNIKQGNTFVKTDSLGSLEFKLGDLNDSELNISSDRYDKDPLKI